MTLLNMVKLRCGIPEAVTVYDESEIKPLIMDAIADMDTAGVKETLLPDVCEKEGCDPRVITAITLYVQSMRGSDRTDSELYLSLYRRKLHKLMLEE